MPSQRCPNCGEPLPEELGQHALTPVSGLVRCPSCGETVTLEHEAGAPNWGGDESFAGSETIEGVMDELGEKEGGPE
jgi:ribosomal protein L32